MLRATPRAGEPGPTHATSERSVSRPTRAIWSSRLGGAPPAGRCRRLFGTGIVVRRIPVRSDDGARAVGAIDGETDAGRRVSPGRSAQRWCRRRSSAASYEGDRQQIGKSAAPAAFHPLAFAPRNDARRSERSAETGRWLTSNRARHSRARQAAPPLPARGVAWPRADRPAPSGGAAWAARHALLAAALFFLAELSRGFRSRSDDGARAVGAMNGTTMLISF